MNKFNKFVLPSVMALLMFSSVWCINCKPLFVFGNMNYSNKQTVETSGEFLDVVAPVEVKEVKETADGYLRVSTNPKSFVVAPLKMEVSLANRDGFRGIHFKKLGYDCYFYGFETISVLPGQECKCGDVLGSLNGDELLIRIYRNDCRVSLKTLMRLLGNV